MVFLHRFAAAVILALPTVLASPVTADTLGCVTAPDPACILSIAAEDAAGIEDDLFRAYLLSDVIALMAKAGLTDAALTLTTQSADPDRAGTRLSHIAEALAASDRDDAALALLDLPGAAGDAQRIHAGIAIGQALSDRRAEAMVTAEEITDPRILAPVLAEAFSTEEAIAFAQGSGGGDGVITLNFQTALVARLAREGNIDAAMDVFYMIADADARSDPRIAIAMAQARAGRVADAIKTSKGMPGPREQIILLLSLNRITPDPLFLQAVRAAADRIPDTSRIREDALFVRAVIDPDGPLADEVAAMISGLTDPLARGRATVSLVEFLAAHGRYSEAAALATGLPKGGDANQDRVHALTLIAGALITDAANP